MVVKSSIMDRYKLQSTVKTISNIMGALSDERGPITAENALNILFDRRFSTLESFQSGWEYLEFCSYEDFPCLRQKRFVKIPSGKRTLIGHLYEQPSPKGLFLCVHGLGGLSEDFSSAYHAYFYQHGYDVLALDLSASGRSQGIGVPGLSQSALDVKSALDYIHSSSLAGLPLFLFGHSWGAYGVSASLEFDSSPLAVFEMSGFADPFLIMTELPKSYIPIGVSYTEPALRKAMEERDPQYAFLSAKQALEKAKNTYCVLIQGDSDKLVVQKASLFGQDYRRNGVEKISMPGRGHGNVATSLESVQYLKKMKENNAFYYREYKKNPTKMSEEERKAYLSSFSKPLCCQLDESLFSRILSIADGFSRKSFSLS